MLEVRNLRKVYKTKKGADVNALDGITLQFPETGMVFLLGKSGSGKSTLLNVCGGLDAPTEGEIIVKGRSSRDFSQSDFDSYRNTFIGFIFQEYNILNEFSVEDNIALALELQGKPKDKAAIKALLEEVDLEGYAKRKPNTLSGGQKQRIAIARALVKSPEIIMADEPTGALDSNTGKQVFDTLKKLSKDKLVLVVSHDREFAELYGDRIIELKDGKILSDVSKTQLEQQTLSANLHAVGDVLCIKRGSDLTEQDFEKIKNFLKGSDEDVIIANNQNDVKNFKKVSRISDEGGKEVFRVTDNDKIEKKQYTKEDSRFIRSRLPMRHAVKIGASSLGKKPIRLVFTALLCTVAFTLFGLLSTLTLYDSHATFNQTLSDSDISLLHLQKDYLSQNTWYSYGEEMDTYDASFSAYFGKSEIKELSAKFGTDAFGGIPAENSVSLLASDSAYWVSNVSSVALLPEGHPLRSQINGEYPKAEDEMVISSYVAEMFVACGTYDHEGNTLSVTNADALIGKKINLGGYVYKITGILNTGTTPPEFDELKNTQDTSTVLYRDYLSYMQDALHGVIFVSEARIDTLAEEYRYRRNDRSQYAYLVYAFQKNGSYEFPENQNAYYKDIVEADASKVIYFDENNATVADGKVVVSASSFASYLTEYLYQLVDEENQKAEEEYNKKIEAGAEVMGPDYSKSEKYNRIAETASQFGMGGYYKVNEDEKTEEFIPFTEEEMKKKLDDIMDFVKKEKIPLKIAYKPFDMDNQRGIGDQNESEIIGIELAEAEKRREEYVYLTTDAVNALWEIQKNTLGHYETISSKYSDPADAAFSTVFLPYTHSEQVADFYWDIYSDDTFGEDDSRIRISSASIDSLRMVDSMVNSLSQVFLYVGIGFAAFAILLFWNFISVSISQKKREIGILRAVGARGSDVFRIFFSESFIIAFICIVLSLAACIVGCGFINAEVVEMVGASIFVFGPISIAILIAIGLATALISTFLPVFTAARKKPVDSIRSL